MTGAGEIEDDGFWTIAESQAGAVASRQLHAAGLTAKEVRFLLRRRVLRTTAARAVYRVADL